MLCQTALSLISQSMSTLLGLCLGLHTYRCPCCSGARKQLGQHATNLLCLWSRLSRKQKRSLLVGGEPLRLNPGSPSLAPSVNSHPSSDMVSCLCFVRQLRGKWPHILLNWYFHTSCTRWAVNWCLLWLTMLQHKTAQPALPGSKILT